jgi:DNA-dependent RNA polymerase auxiliary subunit epsilon
MMPAGEFVMTVYVIAPDENKDGFYIGIDGEEPVRTFFNQNYGHVGPGQRVVNIVRQEAGVAKLFVKAGEVGMIVDRLEIAAPPKAAEVGAGDVTVLEVEEFVLAKGAEVVSHEEASGGKGVLLKGDLSQATLDVNLPAGEFIMTVYVNTANENADGFYIGVDVEEQVRTFFNQNYGHFGAAQRVVKISRTEAGVGKLIVKAGEVGMIVDRFEISVPPEPEPIPELVFNADGVAMLEVEDFALAKGAEVVSNEEASGGKAVLLKGDLSRATFEVVMPAGEFIMTAYENAPTPEADGFYIGVDGQELVRTYFNENYGHFGLASKVCTFSRDETGVAKLIVEAGEYGMLIDRVEITKAEQ